MKSDEFIGFAGLNFKYYFYGEERLKNRFHGNSGVCGGIPQAPGRGRI